MNRLCGFIRVYRIAAAAVAATFFVACGSDAGGPTPPADSRVASVVVSPQTLNLVVGTQQKLIVRLYNAAQVQLTGPAVSWATDAPTVASVAQDGTVSGLTAGTAHVTASSEGRQATVTVIVSTTGGGGGVSGTITVNPAVRYQTINGWEAHAQSGHESPAFQSYKDRLFDLAVNDVGINRLRLEVRSGSENTVDYYQQWRAGQIDDTQWRCVRFATVNDNSDPRSINASGFKFSQMDSMVQNVVLPMRQRLQARGERLFINLTYTAFTNTICSGQYHHDDSAEEYAEIIQAATQHLRTRYNITPDAYEVILEPDNTDYWRGPTIGAAIVATASRLGGMGINAKFIATSTARPANADDYFDALASTVPAAVPHLLELSFHRYGAPTTTDLQGIATRAVQRGISSSMLEHIGSGYQDLHADLKHARVSAWQQFALAFGSNDDGSQYFTVSGSTVNVASRTRFLRQYFKFVRAGAVRVDATSGNTALDPLAFINTNGGYVVVVKATAGASFTVGGLPAGQYGIKYTTTSAYDVDHPDVTLGASQTLSTSIPTAGVLTIYRK